jgi:hypothetical protein
MRPGWNPTRRNRHVGTKAHGHGSNNRLVIPESWHELKCFYECLSSFVLVTRTLAGRDLLFFVEPTRPDWFYPCTVDDICAILSHCPPDDVSSFDFIVLRQPTRKQRILSPVWGRAIYSFGVSSYRGPAIVIEAQDTKPVIWPTSLDPERRRELDRLRADGHDVRRTRHGIEIHVTPSSLRNTVLYRTLLHEVGHHVDYKRCHENEWDSRTRSQKEDFAHRYAHEALQALELKGIIPFAPALDPQSLEQSGLSVEWFRRL